MEYRKRQRRICTVLIIAMVIEIIIALFGVFIARAFTNGTFAALFSLIVYQTYITSILSIATAIILFVAIYRWDQHLEISPLAKIVAGISVIANIICFINIVRPFENTQFVSILQAIGSATFVLSNLIIIRQMALTLPYKREQIGKFIYYSVFAAYLVSNSLLSLIKNLTGLVVIIALVYILNLYCFVAPLVFYILNLKWHGEKERNRFFNDVDI